MSGLLNDRVAIVVGGASGLGDAMARRFAQEGATVVVADIDEPGAKTVADAIVAEGGNAIAVACDVTKSNDVGALVDEASRLGPRIGVLVCSAAVESLVPIVDLSDEEWQRVLDIDLK
jgi:NAD(P)-dependent dehydrogenase (short-subunit alcohol dehydrogenase family)